MTTYKGLTDKNLNLNLIDLKDAWGNFRYLFQGTRLSFEMFLASVEKTGRQCEVNPIEYFKNVGQGKHISNVKEEIDKIIPSTELNPIKRAEIAVNFIEKGNHISVSEKQYMSDVINGKDHDRTMIYFLKKVINSEPFDPCVVVATPKEFKFLWKDEDKVILDGTDRAIVAVVVKQPLSVLEFSLD